MTLDKEKKERPSDTLIYFFYLFMAVFGFAAGTRIWALAETPPSFSIQFINLQILDLLLILCAPGAAVIAAVFLLALFAAGWFILPAVIYIIGMLFGLLCCAFFCVQQTGTDLLTVLTFSVCYLCTIAAVCFMCVYAHRLSRGMSSSGGSRAYIDFGKNTLCAAMVIFVTDIVFAGVIYLQITSA